MDDQKIYYSPFNVTINFIVALGTFTCFAILAVQGGSKAAMTFIIVSVAIGGQFMIAFIKSFVLFTLQRPAIILTKECLIDNSMGVKINWTDINDISIYEYGSMTYLAFEVTSNSIIYRQFLNPLQNILLRLNTALSKKSFLINFSFLKGKNEDIFEMVREYHQNVCKKVALEIDKVT
jgi:hypothetical protein